MSTMRESDTRPGDTLYTIYEHPQQAARKAWNKQDLLDQALDLLEDYEHAYRLSFDERPYNACPSCLRADNEPHRTCCPWDELMVKAGRR